MADDLAASVHRRLVEKAPRILRFDPQDYFPEWQSAVRRSFRQLLGLMPAKIPLEVAITAQTQTPHHQEIHFDFWTEPDGRAAATLRLPINPITKPPVLIHLAPTDFQQPLADGFAALHIPLRGNAGDALRALMVGRTLLGERVWDITRAIDALHEKFADILDPNRIAVMGGVESFYAAAFDPRLGAVICEHLDFFRNEIPRLTAEHTLPNIMHYIDRSDLAGLIVPRPLIAAGNPDCLEEIRQIFSAQQCPDKFAIATGTAAQWQTLRKVLNW